MDRIRLKWVDNGSKRYDGRIEEIPLECVLDEYRAVIGGGGAVAMEVGSKVQARFGQRVWTGVVVEMLERPNALDMALPEKRSCSKKALCCELAVCAINYRCICV